MLCDSFGNSRHSATFVTLCASAQVARRSDIDMNGHINNVTYLGWALETVPLDTFLTCKLHQVLAASPLWSYSLVLQDIPSISQTEAAGAAIVIACPEPRPSLMGDPHCCRTVRPIADSWRNDPPADVIKRSYMH